MVAHDPAREAWPWRGTVSGRSPGAFAFGADGHGDGVSHVSPGAEAFPDRAEIALGAAALTAFTPMFVFISGSVNNDNLVTPLCALALLIMIRQSRRALRR